MLHPEKDTPQHHGHRVVPVLDARLGDQAENTADARIVEDAIEATERSQRELEHRFDVVLLGNIRLAEPDCIAVPCFRRLREHALGVHRIDVGNDNARSFLQKAQRRVAADTVRSAGDHRHLARQSHYASLPFGAIPSRLT